MPKFGYLTDAKTGAPCTCVFGPGGVDVIEWGKTTRLKKIAACVQGAQRTPVMKQGHGRKPLPKAPRSAPGTGPTLGMQCLARCCSPLPLSKQTHKNHSFLVLHEAEVPSSIVRLSFFFAPARQNDCRLSPKFDSEKYRGMAHAFDSMLAPTWCS